MNFLKRQYFTQPYLNSQEYEYFQRKLEEIAQESDPETQCNKLVITGFKGIIPRQDLPSILNQFYLNFENLVQDTLDNLQHSARG
ncbi:MAG: hypothetical protein AB4041_19450 [Microcystaceae cyanobacterium]